MKRTAIASVLLLLSFGTVASGASDLATQYDTALRRYRARDYAAATIGFRAIVSADEKDPLTLRARYFLARSLMKNRSWREAQQELFAIYNTAPSFYNEWSCDFLLGECRRALGEEP